MPGERQALGLEEGRLAHVEKLIARTGEAEAALAGDDGLVDGAASAAAALRDTADTDPGARPLADRAASLAAEAAELSHDVRAYREALEADPARLQEIRERIQALASLERKYGDTEDEVLEFLDRASDRLAALAGADDRREALTAEVDALTASAAERAAAVTAGRAAAAPALASAIEAELQELGMESSVVRADLVPLDEPGPGGAERIELLLSPGAGQAPLSLARAASGGELSRTMLACRSVLADLDAVPDARLRRGGRRHRRPRRPGRRAAARAVGRGPPGPRRDAPAADRVLRRPPVPGHEGGRRRHRARAGGRRSASRRSPACSPGLPGGEGAASHAEELLDEASRVKAGR